MLPWGNAMGSLQPQRGRKEREGRAEEVFNRQGEEGTPRRAWLLFFVGGGDLAVS